MKSELFAFGAGVVALAATGAQAAGTSPATVTPQSLTSTGYSQNFNGLASTGGQVARPLPTGWQIHEESNGTTYGNSNANGFYYGGSSSGAITAPGAISLGRQSTDRALGGRATADVPLIHIGGIFKNDMGGVIDSLTIGYKGEQWLDGFLKATLTFEYSLDATAVNNGTWTSFSALDFVAPSTVPHDTSAVGRLQAKFINDGNTAAFSQQLSGVIDGLAIADGATFGLRWSLAYISQPYQIGDQFFDTTSNDGLAVDDFTLTASLAPAAVPESATWAMFIGGFGMVGGALRRRARTTIAFA